MFCVCVCVCVFFFTNGGINGTQNGSTFLVVVVVDKITNSWHPNMWFMTLYPPQTGIEYVWDQDQSVHNQQSFIIHKQYRYGYHAAFPSFPSHFLPLPRSLEQATATVNLVLSLTDRYTMLK